MVLRAAALRAGCARTLAAGWSKSTSTNREAFPGATVVPHEPSHQVIEELMLAGEMAVATPPTIGDSFSAERHADPDENNTPGTCRIRHLAGYPLSVYQSPEDLQRLLARCAGRRTPMPSITPCPGGRVKRKSRVFAGGGWAITRWQRILAINESHLPLSRLDGVIRLIDRLVSPKRNPLPGVGELMFAGHIVTRTERRGPPSKARARTGQSQAPSPTCRNASGDELRGGRHGS